MIEKKQTILFLWAYHENYFSQKIHNYVFEDEIIFSKIFFAIGAATAPPEPEFSNKTTIE